MSEHEFTDALDDIENNRNLFYRIGLIFSGIGQPKGTRAYKVAMIEMQRLAAPFLAIFIPLILILVLIIFAGFQDDGPKTEMTVEVLKPNETPDLEPPPPPPPPDNPEIRTDFPDPQMTVVSPSTVVQTQATKTVVRDLASPVKMPGVPAGREGVLAGGGGLGGGTRQPGDMVGTLYDFKRDARGNPRKLNYWEDAKTMITGNFTPAAVSQFYKVERNVYLSHLWVPQQDAEIGPKAFGVADLMEPKGWIAHYQGVIQPEESGTYRFVGHFDDAMFVLVDGKVVLEGAWDFVNSKNSVMGWKPKEFQNQHPSPSGQYLIYGDWIEFSADRPRKLDLVVGERPGGKIGGILLIEKQGENYPKASNGRPILPVFLTSPLSFTERDRLEKASFKFNMDKIPLMDARFHRKVTLSTKDDVVIDGIDDL